MLRKFADPGELAIWLEGRAIDMTLWGTGTYKTINNLWDEYEAGEVFFEDDPPLRVVQVVQILLQQNSAILLELEQVLANGKRRFRNQPPSEKIKGNETSIDAAHRCLMEELGLRLEQMDFMSVENEKEGMITDSPSYPGLLTRYTMQKVEARVTGLPVEDFWRENKAAAEGDPISWHLWGWRKPG